MNPDFEPAKPRFNRLRELGRGESTIVELVYDEERQITLARKRWEHTNAETRFRMKQQFRRAQGVQHPNLVRVYDLQVDAQETCLTMEAISGCDVTSYVRELPEAEFIGAVVDILQQLTAALMALHGAGIVHRDLKPRNVLVEASGRVVLLDAGFAWPPEEHFDPQRDRVLAGTLPYLAPECLRGALPSVEADWYSLGALAVELLSGRAPFSGALDAMVRAKEHHVESLLESHPGVPDALDELVCALLDRDPRARPTAEDVKALLDELAEDHPSSPLTAAGTEEPAPAEALHSQVAAMELEGSGELALQPTAAHDERAVHDAAQAELAVWSTGGEPDMSPEPGPHVSLIAPSAGTDVLEPEPSAREAPASQPRSFASQDQRAEPSAAPEPAAAELEHEGALARESDTQLCPVALLTLDALPPSAAMPGALQETAEVEAPAQPPGQGQPASIVVAPAAPDDPTPRDSVVIVAGVAIGQPEPNEAFSADSESDEAPAEPSMRDTWALGAASPDSADFSEPQHAQLDHQLDHRGEQNALAALAGYAEEASRQAVAPAPAGPAQDAPELELQSSSETTPTLEPPNRTELPPSHESESPSAFELHGPSEATPALEPPDRTELPPTLDSESPSAFELHGPTEITPAIEPPNPSEFAPADESEQLEIAIAPQSPASSHVSLLPWTTDPQRSASSDLDALIPPPKTERAVEVAAAAAPPPAAGERLLPAAPPRTPHQPDLDRVEQWLLSDLPAARAVCVRGGAGTGKTNALDYVCARAIERDANWLVLRAVARPGAGAFAALRELAAPLIATLRERPARSLPRALSAAGATALARCLPECAELVSRAGARETLAADPQRQWIDALLAFRALLSELAERQNTLIAIDSVGEFDPDSLRMLHGVLQVAPAPRLRWLFAQDSDRTLPETLAWLIDPSDSDVVPVLLHDLDTYPPSSRRTRPPMLDDETSRVIDGEREETEALLERAQAATAQLALQHAADLYLAACRSTHEPSSQRLQAAAQAQVCAGRLREASNLWLALARRTTEPAEAQRFELAAGAALLRAGDEERGRTLLQATLRACGLHWPRAPLLTSTLERARLLLNPSRRPAPAHEQALRRQRFDVLWGAAKELILIAPTTGDALSMRALREALVLGDPSRLSWAFGYEAASEANIGGTYMRHRAAMLARDAQGLAQQSGDMFDAACARGVSAVVAWFSGQWNDAEQQLRAALTAFSEAQAPSALERHVLENFLVGALEAQGKLDTLRMLLPDLQLTAAATGHTLARALCTLAECSLLALAEDRPLQAIARADAVLAEVGSEEFTPLHFQHFVATVSARLYAGHSAQAFQQVQQTWQRVRHTYLPQLDAVAVMLHQLRARAALALAVHSTQDESARLCKLASKMSDELDDSSLPHAAALAHVIRANLASRRDRLGRADSHCEEAGEIFESCGMQLMSEVARYARGVLGENSAAQQDAARCRSYFARRGVLQPDTFVNAWFPAFRRSI